MPPQLIVQTMGQLGPLVVMVAIATGAMAVTSVLRTLIEQASRTRRLNKALEGSKPNQRPEIILACSQLEGAPADAPEAEALQPDENSQSMGPTSRKGRGRGRRTAR
jgi:hypothetical protein